MPLGDLLNRRSPRLVTCPACQQQVAEGSVFCGQCGVRLDEPEAQPLHIVDRATGLFNERFIRPLLEDELARSHRYQRPLGLLLVEPDAQEGETRVPEVEENRLKVIAAAVAGTIREVDTPGVLSRSPVQLMVVLPDTDMAGTAHAANRILGVVNSALVDLGAKARIGIAAVHPGQRLRAGAAVESLIRATRTGRPELLGR